MQMQMEQLTLRIQQKVVGDESASKSYSIMDLILKLLHLDTVTDKICCRILNWDCVPQIHHTTNNVLEGQLWFALHQGNFQDTRFYQTTHFVL